MNELKIEKRERDKTMPFSEKPKLDERSTKVLNLTVLQRTDPFVEEILITAAHVTFYEFNLHAAQWSRKDVEGSLFVVKRNAQPRFQFIVMNRRNTDNLVENLLGDFEYEIQVPFLLYRNSSQEVNGIWFYNASECEEVGNLFSRILNAYSKVPANSKVSATKSEFEELAAVPSVPVIDGSLEPSLSTSTNNNTDVQDDSSFINIFSNALSIGAAPNATNFGQQYPYAPSATVTSPPHTTLPTARRPSNLCIPKPTISFTSVPNTNHSTDLVTPSFFSPPPISSPLILPPISPSMPNGPPLNPNGNIQRPYGTPLLQPFPPPTPPPSLTPTSVPSPNYRPPAFCREKIREALQLLVQDNQFIDMVSQALVNAHQS